MKQAHFNVIASMIIAALVVLSLHPVSSAEAAQDPGVPNDTVNTVSTNEEGALNDAREKLENAFDNYQKGDIAATKKDLNKATELLNKAAENSKTEKTRKEAGKLAIEVDSYRKKINRVSEEQDNSLVRYWHLVTSIIKRESDHLIHSYVESSIADKTLKHLLDAKMHLFRAEHDLFVSHEEEDAEEELGNVLEYLNEAREVASPPIQSKIIALSNDIQLLKENVSPRKGAWKKDSVVQSLKKATEQLSNANKNASPPVKLRIESLKADIDELRVNVERNNIKNDYEASMAKLRDIINEL